MVAGKNPLSKGLASPSGPAGPRHASAHFLLAGDLEHGLATVRVIDWGQPGSFTRMTLAGPAAHDMRQDDEIEATIRTERLYGGCRPTVPDGQLIVELVVADGQQVCGLSYTLALVLADKRARGCLPRLRGRTLIASGQVKRDGAVVPVGRLAEKLAALARAAAERPMAAPLLVLAQGNLDTLTTEEQGLLQGLGASGIECIGVAALADLGTDWPPPAPVAPGRDLSPGRWRRLRKRLRARGRGTPTPAAATVPGWRRWWWLALALAMALIALLVGLYYYVYIPFLPCARLSADPAVIERCWGAQPVTLRAECNLVQPNGDRRPRRCPSGTCLAAGDGITLEVRPNASGWLYVYFFETGGQEAADLRPQQRPWSVLAGQRLPLTLTPQTSAATDHPAPGRFVAVLTHAPLPSLDGVSPSVLKEFLDSVADEFVVCGDPQ